MKISAPFVHNFDRAAFSSFFFYSSALLPSLWGRRKLKAHSKIIIAFLPSRLPASDFLPQSKQTDGIPPFSAKKLRQSFTETPTLFVLHRKPCNGHSNSRLPTCLASRCHTCARWRHRPLPLRQPPALKEQKLSIFYPIVAITAAWYSISVN